MIRGEFISELHRQECETIPRGLIAAWAQSIGGNNSGWGRQSEDIRANMKILAHNGHSIKAGSFFVRREISKSNPLANETAKPTLPQSSAPSFPRNLNPSLGVLDESSGARDRVCSAAFELVSRESRKALR